MAREMKLESWIAGNWKKKKYFIINTLGDHG